MRYSTLHQFQVKQKLNHDRTICSTHFLQSITLLADHLSTYHLRLTNQQLQERKLAWLIFNVSCLINPLYGVDLSKSPQHWIDFSLAAKTTRWQACLFCAPASNLRFIISTSGVCAARRERILLLFAELITSS
jgi:hypothetical protein